LVCGLRDGRDAHVLARVEEVLDEHHRVVSLLESLPVEVRGELLEGLRIEVDGDRHILVRRGELVRDLLVQRLDEAAPGHRCVHYGSSTKGARWRADPEFRSGATPTRSGRACGD